MGRSPMAAGRGRGTATRGRGRPRKIPNNDGDNLPPLLLSSGAARGRGRPRKIRDNQHDDLPRPLILSSAVRGRGRPRKIRNDQPENLPPLLSSAAISSEKNQARETPNNDCHEDLSPATSSAKQCKRNPQNNRYQHLSSHTPLLVSAITVTPNFLAQNDLHLHPSQTLALESRIASSALSLTKFNSLLETLVPPETVKSLTPLSSLSSSACWFQRFLCVASNDSDSLWIEAFRMSKPSFALLLQALSPSLQNSLPTSPPDYTLGAALFRLAHAASYKSVGRRFGLDSASACRAFYVVCKAINDHLSHLFELTSDLGRIIEYFGWISLLIVVAF
ncbi:hypothetical protein NE237_024794 [Protea cynaroides]|uniref:Uncharacterized protein n=1 Tax=Protea cynaroides TaxID=273540 RepID=A0A9Q0H3N6_9MAGN|nr:hypothetical protein NE237_024794 [Protea cynaroides]